MPAINIADIQIPVQMVQNTTPSLKIMDSSGAVESKTINSSNMDGGAGGSGTTGTSDVSFVRIYRFG